MALGDGTSWDESVPTDGSAAKDIDDYNRDLRKGVRLRMDQEHIWPSSQSAVTEGGMHRFITLEPKSSAPAIPSGQAGVLYTDSNNNLLYKKSGGSPTRFCEGTVNGTFFTQSVGGSDELFFQINGSSDQTQITSGGQINVKLSTKVGKSVNTVYQADTDGFVIALGNNAYPITGYGYTDNTSNPTTIVAKYSPGENVNASDFSLMFPVKKGDYWKVTNVGTIFWIPLTAGA